VGDGFPQVWPDFGPGVIAAFMGAQPVPGPGMVWFQPQAEQEITELKFADQSGNVWRERVEAISRAALERWRGMVQVGMTDLGGNLDIPSTFRPAEKLLLGLIDHPADVKHLTWDAHHLWWRYFAALNAVLQPLNPGSRSKRLPCRPGTRPKARCGRCMSMNSPMRGWIGWWRCRPAWANLICR
jgi:5-methyltetrahydrofolate--homocysteine methyltransferase